MAAEKDVRAIATLPRDALVQKAKGACAVRNECGIFHARIETIIGDRDDDAGARERLAQRAIDVLAAALPTAAVEEQQHRRRCGERIGHVEVKTRARTVAIRDVAHHRVAGFGNGQIEERRTG